MPSPVKKFPKGKFYKREDGAWIKKKGMMKKVGSDKLHIYKCFGWYN